MNEFAAFALEVSRPGQIGQILVNLINNALDAVTDMPDKWIRIAVSHTESHLFISVADSGKGVPSAIRHKIFEPFFTSKQVGKGTGLGLSISRSLALSHGGDLFLDEASGNTQFTLRLPKSQG